jgi:hypothetical protein
VSVLCPGFVRTNIFTSQRNRPANLRNEVLKAEARAANRALIEQPQGIDPSVVADRVADAVRTGRFWILTHPELLEEVDRRHRSILSARQG